MADPAGFATAYADAAGTAAGLVARIDDGLWSRPGLGEWDLRALVGHTSRAMVTVLTYLDRPARTEDIPSPEAYYCLLPAQTGEGADATAVAGGVRVGSYVPTRTVELVVHGLDIAAAAGVPAAFSRHALAEAVAVLARSRSR